MINVDLKDLLKDGISRYSLVVGVAKRSRDLSDEAKANGEILVEKPVSLAVEDLLDGYYSIKESEEISKY
ncbi:MAG: DNA-directed RNA polymerase subunit omega [Clostridia bacterium]|nr:DNA-directed RNA polymerase subunit omega [Clostridia bacterium]MBR3975239.1 DNA-directed RNA polymerase subunit omega [Clostridia bacterium]